MFFNFKIFRIQLIKKNAIKEYKLETSLTDQEKTKLCEVYQTEKKLKMTQASQMTSFELLDTIDNLNSIFSKNLNYFEISDRKVIGYRSAMCVSH
jgi:hypothetical protein